MWTTTVALIHMTTLLIQNAYIVTMDDHQREIPDGGLFIRDGFIEQVSPTQCTALHGRCRARPHRSPRPARPRQHAPSLLPDPDARHPCRPGRQSLHLADHALSPLGAPEPRRHLHCPRKPRSPNSPCRDAPPPPTTSIFSPTVHAWTTKLPPRTRWDSASTPRAARCPSAHHKGDCRLMPLWTAKRPSSGTPSASSNTIMTRAPARWCRSSWRPVRPFPSRRT